MSPMHLLVFKGTLSLLFAQEKKRAKRLQEEQRAVARIEEAEERVARTERKRLSALEHWGPAAEDSDPGSFWRRVIGSKRTEQRESLPTIPRTH